MERAGAELPVLIGQTGPLNGQRWQIDSDVMVGRDASCDIIISDRQVSRFHARLSLTEDGVLLEDLGSKNGTFCNGNRLEDPVLLSDGDLIQISLVQHFVFLSSDATVPLEFEAPSVKGAARSSGEGSAGPAQGSGAERSRLYLDLRSRRVWVGSEELVPPLSVPQFRLLQLLYDQHDEVVERQDLINYIWGEEESIGVSEQAFDALVRRLRDRLAMVDPDHNYIVTVRGHGLRLDNPKE